MQKSMVCLASVLIGLGNLYPLLWFVMFLLVPEIGRKTTHEHVITQAIATLSVGSLLNGLAILGGKFLWGGIVTVMTTKSVLSKNTKRLFIRAQRFPF